MSIADPFTSVERRSEASASNESPYEISADSSKPSCESSAMDPAVPSSVMTSALGDDVGDNGGRPPRAALPGLAPTAVPGLAPTALPGLAVVGRARRRSPSAAASGSARASGPDMPPADPLKPSGSRGVRDIFRPFRPLVARYAMALGALQRHEITNFELTVEDSVNHKSHQAP